VNIYIGLFRGINVGGKNILPMRELVSILKEIGYENIRTYIQSGNVVFSSKKIIGPNAADEISREIERKIGFSPKVVILSAKQLQNSINNNPFPTIDGKALHFFFLESLPESPDIERLKLLKAKSEKFALEGRVFYLHAPEGVGRSKLAAAVEKSIGVPLTARNWNTVNKLSKMVEEE
jgi:uncharacterized protein (DUF1697 family)